MSLRRKVPWLTDDVRDAKRQMRRWERLWHKYKSDELWTAFCVARSYYKRMLYSLKREVISSKVMDCGKDTQKLYTLVNNLLGPGKRIAYQVQIHQRNWLKILPTFSLKKWKRFGKNLTVIPSMYHLLGKPQSSTLFQ